jgi:hypothetical protein
MRQLGPLFLHYNCAQIRSGLRRSRRSIRPDEGGRWVSACPSQRPLSFLARIIFVLRGHSDRMNCKREPLHFRPRSRTWARTGLRPTDRQRCLLMALTGYRAMSVDFRRRVISGHYEKSCRMSAFGRVISSLGICQRRSPHDPRQRHD